MDENSLDDQNKKANNEPKNKSEKSLGSAKEPVKVPKKAAVVFNTKNVGLEDAKLKKELEKQKLQAQKQTEQALEKQKQLELEKEKNFSKTQKEQSQLQKKEKKEQTKLQKLEKKEQIKQEKQSKKQAPKKDYGLNDLNELENRILNRKETESERRKRIVIIILSIILIIVISIGSCTAKKIIDDQKPKPVEVKIEIIVEGLEKTPIDPNNPDLGYIKHIVYPGDVIDVGFYVYNTPVTAAFPVYVRFRAYIIMDDLTEHSVFIPYFINGSSWLALTDENGLDLDIDDWYYYAGAIPVGIENKIQIINKLKLRTDLDNKYQGKDFTLVLEVQAIQGSQEAATEIFEEWWLAPDEWYAHMDENNWYSYLINSGA